MVTSHMIDVLLGALALLVLVAALLTLPVSLLIQRLYRGAVRRAMAASSGAAPAHAAPAAPAAPPPPGPVIVEVGASTWDAGWALAREGERARRRLAAAYAAAGAALAVSMAVLVAIAHEGNVKVALFYVFVCAWPVLLVVLRTVAPRRRIAAAWVAGYAAAGTLIAVVAGDRTAFAVSMLALMAVPTVLTALAWSRTLGANAPLVLVALVGIAGAVSAAFWTFTILAISFGSLLSPVAVLGTLLVVLALALALRAGLRRVTRLYRRKRLSDEMLSVDACWLVLCVWLGFMVTTAQQEQRPAAALLLGALALAPFVVYRVSLGMALRAYVAGAGRPAPVKLLVLRAFGARSRSERLFGALERRWRHLGSMNLIAGTDLVTLNLEPHELLEFVGGRLAARFVKSEAEACAAVDALDHAPDPDGRYRSNELFCHDDTWRAALGRAARACDAVLLDLRGFTPENRGCVFELGQMIHRVPLRRVVLVVDGTTRRDALETLARRAWTVMAADSPNRLPGNGVMRLYRMERQTPSAVDELVALLCEAAAPAPASAEAGRPAVALAG